MFGHKAVVKNHRKAVCRKPIEVNQVGLSAKKNEKYFSDMIGLYKIKMFLTDKQTKGSEQAAYKILLILASLFFAFHLIPNYSPLREYLWGVFHLSFFSWWQQAIFISLSIMAVAGGFILEKVKKGGWDEIIYRQRKGLFLAVAILSAISFYYFRTSHFLWGDSFLCTTSVNGPLFISPNEIGEVLLHRSLYRLFLFLKHPISGEQIYSYSSMLAGVTFMSLWVSFCFRNMKREGYSWMWLLAPMASGSMMLFFGHSEHYAIFNVLVLAYLISLLRADSRRGTILALALLVNCIFMHLAGLSLIPSFLVHILMQPMERRSKIILLGIVLAASIIAAGLAAVYMATTSVHKLSLLLSVLYSQSRPYAMLSWPHIRDITNLLLLVAPLPIMLIGASHCKLSSRSLVFFVASCSALLAVFMIEVLFEAGDWDLMSFAGQPFMFWAMVSAEETGVVKKPFMLAGLILGIALFHTLPWIGLNSSIDRIFPAYKTVAGSYKHNDRTLLFVRSSMQLASTGNLDKAIEIGKIGLSYDSTDVRIYHNMAIAALKGDQRDSARAWEIKALGIDSNYVRAWSTLGSIFTQEGNYNEALKAYDRAIFIEDTVANYFYGKAYALSSLKRYRESLSFLERAIELDPREKKLYQLLFYSHFALGNYQEALVVNSEALRIDPKDSESWLYQGILFFILGDSVSAEESWNRALAMDSGNHKAASLTDLYKQNRLTGEMLKGSREK
jgi:Tfp pilus assembly protein PilF